MSRYIESISGYLPLLRLHRADAAKMLRFSGLGGRVKGTRAVSDWDEDAMTMALEASRNTLNPVNPSIDDVIFASTSSPYKERSQATLIVDALHLSPKTRSLDVSGSRRCAISSLLSALLGTGTSLLCAGENRFATAGSPAHLNFGDGGAATIVSDQGSAKFLGFASLSHGLIDIYSSDEHPSPYAYEPRFAKETSVNKVIVPTVLAACADAKIKPEDITFAAVHEPLAGCWRAIAKKTGITAPNISNDLLQSAGDLGAAHVLYAFALACHQAKVGDVILLAGFGSGCDALLFEITGEMPGAAEAAAQLTSGLVFNDYVRFLALSNALTLDGGARAEFEQKAQATVIERYGRNMMGFIGGRDRTGNVQFPKSKFPVHPDATEVEELEDVRLADDIAQIVSITADRLVYSPAPPFWFGLAQFENGARVMIEFTDADEKGFVVGDKVRMKLRIKSHNKRLGFRTYFWKAVPLNRPEIKE